MASGREIQHVQIVYTDGSAEFLPASHFVHIVTKGYDHERKVDRDTPERLQWDDHTLTWKSNVREVNREQS